MKRAPRLLLLGLFIACRTPPDSDGPDAGAAVPVDAQGATRDLAGCARHQLVSVPLDHIELVDSLHPLYHGAALRVAVQFPWRPACDIAGPVQVDVQPGNATDFITLTAHLWRSSAPDASCGATASLRRVLLLSDGPVLNNPTRRDLRDRPRPARPLRVPLRHHRRLPRPARLRLLRLHLGRHVRPQPVLT
jgi:hypothetical protein